MRRNRDDRRKAIEQEAEGSRREGGGFGGSKYIISEDELAKLGVRKYIVDSGENPKEGRTHSWSFLEPNPKDPCVVGLGLYIHYRIGVNEESFLCPRFMKREFERLQSAWPDADFPIPDAIKHGRCPICEKRDANIAYYKAEREAMSEEDRKAWHKTNIRNLEPFNGGFTDPKPNRYLGWIVDESEGGDRLDDGVQLVEFATGGRNNPGVHKGLMDQAVVRESGEVLDVLDPSEDGYKFSFYRSGKTQADISYSGHKLKPRREALDDEWLDAVPRFTDVLVFAGYDTIKEAFIGVADTPDDSAKIDQRRQEAEEVSDNLVEAYQGEKPRRRRRRSESDDEPNPTEPAPGAEKITTADRNTAENSPRRRRRAEPEPADDEPSEEAKALARRVRNRQRRKEESNNG